MRSPPDWRGRTVACLASGPSLMVEDCVAAREAGCVTIVTNTTFRLCPWADALFAFDSQWWKAHISEVRRSFGGRLFTQSLSYLYREVETTAILRGWRSFGNSGANAVALAIVCGAPRVILLGYDCALTGGRSHHHGDHPTGMRNCDTLPRWPAQFARLATFAAKRGVEVVNASRASALECFPRATLAEALP